MAFFPSYLRKRYQLKKQAETRTPFHEDCIPSIKEILNSFNDDMWEPHMFLNEYDLNSTDNVELYQICTNYELRKTLQWISNKILSTIGIDNSITVGVYIRISTSMINKLVDDGIITKQFGIYYHDNFVRNATDLMCIVNTEDLPF